MDSEGDCVIFPKCIQWTVGLDLLVTTDSILLSKSVSNNWNISETLLMSMFWTVLSQRLYNWAAIWWGGMVVICLNTSQSILNFQNWGWVISGSTCSGLTGFDLVVEGVVVIAVGWILEGEVCCCSVSFKMHKISPIIVTPSWVRSWRSSCGRSD